MSKRGHLKIAFSLADGRCRQMSAEYDQIRLAAKVDVNPMQLCVYRTTLLMWLFLIRYLCHTLTEVCLPKSEFSVPGFTNH